MEEPPRRAYSGSLMHFVSDLSLDGLYRALLGVAVRQFGSGSVVSAVGQEFLNAGHGWRRCGSRNFVFVKIYGAFRNQGSISLSASASDVSTDLDHALRFARTLMNVGLFWFFIQAWAEKAGYLRNPHSNDEIDLPFEFAGTMLGFWMARVLTKPFDPRSEKFRSTFVVDFLSAGVIGLLYTLIVGA